jgi:hypothetical protein
MRAPAALALVRAGPVPPAEAGSHLGAQVTALVRAGGQVGQISCRITVKGAHRRRRVKGTEWTPRVDRKQSQRAIGGEGVQDRC